VDRETVCWYMNRLGLSLRDVLTDLIARRWLGRALGVRFFVLGDVRETASFVVTTHLVDAECGYDYGWGSVHVQSPFELRLRLGELVAQTLLDPAERQRRQQEAELAERERRRLAELAEGDRLRALRESQNVPLLILEAQRLGDGGNLSVSIELLGRARRLRPDNIEVSFLFNRFNDRNRRSEWEGERAREWQGRQAALAAAQQQQQALARAAEEARLLAAQQAAARQAGDAQILEQQRQQASAQLQAQAQLALQQQQFNLSVQLYQSALAMKQTDALYQALAQAQARAADAERQLAANLAAQQAAALQQQRDADLAKARQQLLENRRNQEAREQADRAAQAARDQALYQQMLSDAQRQLAKEQFDAAISALQTARQMRRTDEVERLLSQALAEQARATALKANPAGKADLERQLAEEKSRREKAEAEAARNRDLYETSLKLAQKALAAKDYTAAEAKYQDAGKVFNTDVVLTGLRTVHTAKAEDAAAQAKRDAEAKKAADFQRMSDAGVAALDQKQYDLAMKTLSEANQIKPNDVKVLTALTKAKHEQADAALRAKASAEAAQRETAFHQFLDGGKANLAAKHYDAAVVSLKEAVRMKPADKEAAAALQAAESAHAQTAKTEEQQAQAKKTADAYQKAMIDGRAALAAKQYDAAAASFGQAQKLLPGDASSAEFVKQTASAKATATAAVADAAKKAEEAARQQQVDKMQALKKASDAKAAADQAAAKKSAEVVKAQGELAKASKETADKIKKQLDDYTLAMGAGKAAVRKGDYPGAINSYTEALRIQPGDKDAASALQSAQQIKAATDADAKMKAEEAKRQADAARLAAQAKAAQAEKMKRDADNAAAAARKAAEAKHQAEVAGLMTQGQTALTGKKYDDAIKAYSAALQLQPGDAKATAGLKSAQFSQHMAQGQSLGGAKKFADAVKEYDAALTIFPDNPDAKAALKRAKANMP